MYGTVAGYREYHTDRGRDVSAQTDDAVIAGKLLLASEWIDGRYGDRFMGFKVDQQAQVRDWPRVGAVDRDGYAVSSASVPYQIEWATYEVAYREMVSPGVLNQDYTPSKYSRVVITGAVDVTYRDQSAIDIQAQFPIVDQVLSSLLGAYGAVSSLSGKTVRA